MKNLRKNMPLIMVLGLCLLLHSAKGHSQVRRYPGKNLNAPLLVFDIGSLASDMGIDNFDRCAEACKNVAGCNGVVYCDHTGGCGSAGRCNPANFAAMAQSPNDYRDSKLPITKPGFHQPATGACTPDGRYRHKLCSLKKVADLNNPVFFADSTQGWVSATLDMVPGRRMGACSGNKPLAMCDFCDSFNELIGTTAHSQCWTCLNTITNALPTPFTLWQAMRSFKCLPCFAKEPDNEDVDRSRCINFVTRHAASGLPELAIPFP